MSELQILVIDDQVGRSVQRQRTFVELFGDLNNRLALQFSFSTGQRESEGIICNCVETALEFCATQSASPYTIVLLDLSFDSGVVDEFGIPAGREGDSHFGETLYRAIRQRFEEMPVILVTSTPQIDSELGDVPYINKESIGSESLIRCLVEATHFPTELTRSLIGVPAAHVFQSPEMTACYSKGFLHAAGGGSVLITGESGVGKELLAQFVAGVSNRSGRYVAIDIGSTPADLAEAEWFGIEKGTATGVEKRIGRFELASDGVLFLDEIADISLPLQAKLLRVLQSRSLQRVGGREPVELQFKLLSATSRSLDEHMVAGSFREDLYYRIADVVIHVPPLRERRSDISPLAVFLVSELSQEFGIRSLDFADDALQFLEELPLRGNVRELRGILGRAIAGLSSFGTITRVKLESVVAASERGASLDQKIVAPSVIASRGSRKAVDELFDPGLLLDVGFDGLRGSAARLNERYRSIAISMVREAFIASRHPVSGRLNRQRAAQLLADDADLRGQDAIRFLNRLLGRKISDPLSVADCEALMKRSTSEDEL
jgi:DNA-binding NtrC family response regulator